MAQMLSTRDAATALGWPTNRLHEIAQLVPEFVERRVGGKAGRNASNGWPAETIEIVRIMQGLGFGHTQAVRIACVARLVDGRVVINPIDAYQLQN